MKKSIYCGFFFLILSSCSKTHTKHLRTEALNSAIIPMPNPEVSIQSWWLARHEAVNATLLIGDSQLLFFGNSIVHGFEGAGKEVWQKYYANRGALNMGFGWDRTQHLLWRLDNSDFSNVSAKLAVVLIGTNNIGRNTPEEIIETITLIVQRIRSKIAHCNVLLLGILPRYIISHPDRLNIAEINAGISKLADNHTIYFIDIGQVFLDNSGDISKEIMADGLHPTTQGYYLLAEAIEPLVKELVR